MADMVMVATLMEVAVTAIKITVDSDTEVTVMDDKVKNTVLFSMLASFRNVCMIQHLHESERVGCMQDHYIY